MYYVHIFNRISPYADAAGMVGLVASIVAKFSTTAAYMMMYQQSDELFPTPLRSFSVGVITALAGTFTAVVPYLVYLVGYPLLSDVPG